MSQAELSLPASVERVSWTDVTPEALYAKLNTLDLSEEQKQEIVDEANRVFTLNIGLFNELEGGKRAVVKAVWGVVVSAVKARFSRKKGEAVAE